MRGQKTRSSVIRGSLAALAVGLICGCGSARQITTPSTTTPGSTTAERPVATDSLTPADINDTSRVTIVAAGGSALTVTSPVPMPDGSQITSEGSAIADLTFAHTSACALQQTGTTAAHATSRIPPSALLELTQGLAICTVPSVPAQIRICGSGIVFANGTGQQGSQFDVTCDQDPVFAVDVLHGTLRVVDPSGAVTNVVDGQELSCVPTSCAAQIGPASFTDSELAIWSSQAEQLDYTPPSTSTSSTSSTSTTSSTATNLSADATVKQALVTAFAIANKLDPSDIDGTEPGSVYYAVDPSSDRYWAEASFVPSARAQQMDSQLQGGPGDPMNYFQDQPWVFSRPWHGAWQVVTNDPGGPCPGKVPAAVTAAWQIQPSSACS
jgi:hypothetical protein